MTYFRSVFQSLIFVFLLCSCGNSSDILPEKSANVTFTNPIVTADFSDPDVIRVGNDYYMTASSFYVAPGLPVLHSKDLVNWTIIGHGIKQNPNARFTYRGRSKDELDYSVPRFGMGVYAPSLRYHDGFFWIFWGDPDAGVYMIKTEDPAADWSEPVLVQEASGIIDPSPLWDETTGKAWLSFAYASSRSGKNSIIDVCEMSWDGTTLIGDPVTVFDARDSGRFPADRFHRTIEGTKFMQHDGWYYILCPAGGVEPGWQTAMRAKDPFGPYEIRTVCETGSTKINGPHQGGLLESYSGEWWFIHFQSTGTLGRIVRLEPAYWENGWPVIGIDDDNDGIGNPVSSYHYPHPPELKQVQTSDDFNSGTLGLQWQWVANPKDNWYELKDGNLLLPAIYSANDPLFETPHVLTQMFPDFSFTATTKMALSDAENVRGGLASFGRKTFDIGIEQLEKAFRISVRFNNDILVSAFTQKSDNIWLRLKTTGEMPKPLERRESNRIDAEVIERENLQPYEYEDLERWRNGLITGQFSYSFDGEIFTDLGEPFEVRSGRWTGARIGLYSLKTRAEGNGHVAFDYIKIEK
jgi:beta-xylosidase